MEKVVITAKREKQTKVLYVAVIVLLCVMFVGGFGIGLVRVMSMEGKFPPVAREEALTPAPETAEEVSSFLEASVQKALADKPKAHYYDDFSIDTDSIETSFGGLVPDSFKFIADGLEKALDDKFDSKETDFSEDFSSFFRDPEIAAADIEDFACHYIYYRCSTCGESSEEPKASCEICNSKDEYVLTFRDDYDIVLDLAESDAVRDRNFAERTADQILDLLGDGYKDVCEIDPESIDVSHDRFELEYKVRRTTDELTKLAYIKDMTVSMKLTFTGDYAYLGTGTVSAKVTEKVVYDFTWPSVRLNKHAVTVEPGATDNATATRTCSDPLNTKVTWTSSDESILTVDEEGYFKADKHKTGDVIVTASMEFNGKTYTDECLVRVRVPVESSSMSKRKLTLSPGEGYDLSVKVSPKKATIKTVTWYSENEAVATVDENGHVTAVAPGVAVIYSLTDDEYYKSTCEVTVE